MDKIREAVDDLACGDDGCACNHPKEQYDELLAYVVRLEGVAREVYVCGVPPSLKRPEWLQPDAMSHGGTDV